MRKIQYRQIVNKNKFMFFSESHSQKNQHNLSKIDLEGLSPQEKQYAQEQFRVIYAEQMSKIMIQLGQKKKVHDNLNQINEKQEKSLKEQYEKLKVKMASIEEKRNKKLQDKVKNYKHNDERWFHKLKEIHKKFKNQKIDAFKRAQNYRQESQSFWKNKSKRIQLHNSKVGLQRSRSRLERSYGEKIKPSNNFKVQQPQRRVTIHQDIFKSSRQQKGKELNQEIQLHREKSQHLQKQKQEFIFNKAVQKMELMEKRRQKITKQKQVKVPSPTKPKKVDHSHASIKQKQMHHQNELRKDRSLVHNKLNSKSKESLDNLIKQHIQQKKQLEQKQFQHRGEIMQHTVQRNRKDRILKMVKSRVHEIKVSALKKQSSSKGLLYN